MGTVGAFLKGRACSDTLLNVLNRVFDEPMKSEECAAMPLAGGMMQHGYQCGMIWGTTLAAGAQAYRLFGPGAQAETRAIVAAQGLVEAFRARHNTMRLAHSFFKYLGSSRPSWIIRREDCGTQTTEDQAG